MLALLFKFFRQRMKVGVPFLFMASIVSLHLPAISAIRHANAAEASKVKISGTNPHHHRGGKAKKPKHLAKKPLGSVSGHSKKKKLVVTEASHVKVADKVAELSAPASFGEKFGLHATHDPLALKSSVALILDQDSNEVLLSKNSGAVLPIASLTKLMTAVVVVEAGLPLDEMMTVSADDVDLEKNSHSRLVVGAKLSRETMLHLALMSSENRAAHALGRYFPGGLPVFVTAMNDKAKELGMTQTRYVEPTGLSSQNQSSAQDLATLVKYAYRYPVIRAFSTSPESAFQIGNRSLQFRNTNGLVRNPGWEIGLQKTGYITEAGRCLVMQTHVAGRRLIMVFLDSVGKYSRLADAERVKRWISSTVQQAGGGGRSVLPTSGTAGSLISSAGS
jgi:D-alanyl-D-alanine endopeptidase (penicillin-binding protein 7)